MINDTYLIQAIGIAIAIMKTDCAICAGGAVMANRLKIELTIRCTPSICAQTSPKD